MTFQEVATSAEGQSLIAKAYPRGWSDLGTELRQLGDGGPDVKIRAAIKRFRVFGAPHGQIAHLRVACSLLSRGACRQSVNRSVLLGTPR
jgi:hypothetical protein